MRWRKATWTIIVWVVVGLVLFLAQLLRVRASECIGGTGFEYFCRFSVVSRAFDGMLGVATAFFLGAALLGVIWVYTIPRNPPCPHCNRTSRTDYGVCRWCGHMFLRPPA